MSERRKMSVWQKAVSVGLVSLSSVFGGTSAQSQDGTPFVPYPLDPPKGYLLEREERSDLSPLVPHDFAAIESLVQGEGFIIPTSVHFEVDTTKPDGTPLGCADILKGQGDSSSQRVCASVVGLEPKTPVEESEAFLQSAQRIIDDINRSMIDSGIPIRVTLRSIYREETASCAPSQEICIIVEDLTRQGYLGYVDRLHDYREPYPPLVDRPYQNPIHLDSYALSSRKACAPNVINSPGMQDICNGKTIVGNHVAAHELGHDLGLVHTFPNEPSCSSDADDIPDTSTEFSANYTWGCLPGQTQTLADSCHVSFEQDPESDNTRNKMSYFYERKPDGTHSSDGKIFTYQQGLVMVMNLIQNYPQLAQNSQVFSEMDFSYSFNEEEGSTTMVISGLKEKVPYSIRICFNYTQTDDCYYYPSDKNQYNQQTPWGTTDTYTATTNVPITETLTVFYKDQSGHKVPMYWFIDESNDGDYIHGENFTTIVEGHYNPQQLSYESGTPPEPERCVAVPYSEYAALPVIMGNGDAVVQKNLYPEQEGTLFVWKGAGN